MAQLLYDGKPLIEVEAAGKVSDGYHTFDELYDHRCVLFMALLECFDNSSWKSRAHADGEEWPGWFIAGCSPLEKPVSYHLPEKFWADCPGEERDRAPEWDGHTSADVLARLLEWVRA